MMAYQYANRNMFQSPMQLQRPQQADRGTAAGLRSSQDLSVNLANSLNNQTAMNQGMLNLQQILASQGEMDPRLRNRVMTNIGRQTEAQQLMQSQSAAQRGMQGSGALQAINAAIGMAGGDRMAAADADFARQAEDRKRQDLALLLELLINPSLQQIGIAAGVGESNANRSAQRFGAWLNALSSGGRSAAMGGG